MTVREAIEILKTMPQEALLATHANNHTANDNIRIAEGFFRYNGADVDAVFIGNLNPDRLHSRSGSNEWLKEPVVMHEGERKG